MKYLITFIIIYIFVGCKPSLQQIEKYELVKSLEKGFLVVTLEDKTREILLLRKYGQNKKAQKLAQKTIKNNYNIKKAILNNYNYSKVAFAYKNKYLDSIIYKNEKGDLIEIQDEKHIYNLSLHSNEVDYYNTNNREGNILTLKISSKNNNFYKENSISVFSNLNNNIYGYSMLLKKMNHKLHKINKKAKIIQLS